MIRYRKEYKNPYNAIRNRSPKRIAALIESVAGESDPPQKNNPMGTKIAINPTNTAIPPQRLLSFFQESSSLISTFSSP